MPIEPANKLSWNPPPRCPKCGVGITPSGQGMPFATDSNGGVYCRVHGHEVEADYPDALAEYEEWRRRRLRAIQILKGEVEPTTDEGNE